MLNSSVIGLLSFVLVYKNVILLNEEILILICFSTFCWIVFNHFKEVVYSGLAETSLKSKTSLNNSFNQLIKIIMYGASSKKSPHSIATDFKSLEKHFSNLNTVLIKSLPKHLTKNSEKTYPQSFLLIRHLEERTIKILPLIISKKLSKIVAINNFCTHKLKISLFSCKYSINLREYVRNI